MVSLRNSLHRRTHRERAQPLNRQKLGILEKEKDHLERAHRYHRKQGVLNRLKEKAADRNRDEFYFAMTHEKTNRGVHVKTKKNASLSTDIAAVLKAQDANYIRTMKRANARRIASLKAQLAAMANLVNSAAFRKIGQPDEGDWNVEDEGEGIGYKQEGESENDEDGWGGVGEDEPEEDSGSHLGSDNEASDLEDLELEVLREAKVIPPALTDKKALAKSVITSGHVVFVDDEETALSYKPPNHRKELTKPPPEEPIELGWINDGANDNEETGGDDSSTPSPEQLAKAKKETKKHRAVLLRELAARLERDKHLRYAEQELDMQRLTMAGKGAKRKIRDGGQVFQEEEEEEEFAMRRKGRIPVRELGNEVYKPKVFKWRKERKR